MPTKFNEYTTQITKMQNDKRIMFASLQVKDIRPEAFLDEWEAKVIVCINEYVGTKPSFYLTYKELKAVQLCISQNTGLATPFQHFMGNRTEADGEFKGLSYNSLFSLNYDTSRTLAWSVSITAGYAKALPGKQTGTHYPQKGSFQKTASATYYMDYPSIKYFFDECIRRYEYAEKIVRDRVFAPGLKGYTERIERGTATARIPGQVTSAPAQNPTKAPAAVPPASAQKQNPVPVSGLFQGMPAKRADGKGFDAQILTKGKIYNVVIRDKDVTPQLVAEFKKGSVVNLISWQEDGLLYVGLPA